MSSTPAAPPVGWCLESTFDGGKHLERVPIEALPFRIGRVEGLELTIPSKSVSKHHAEIFVEDGMLRLRDLSSTNGTFVNRERVSGASLREGDIVHFAEFEFRLGRQPADGLRDGEDTFAERRTLALGHIELPAQFVKGTRELGELLEEQKAGAVFQPIVSLQSGEVAAYEILGRGRHDGLPESPAELFRIASTVAAGSRGRPGCPTRSRDPREHAG